MKKHHHRWCFLFWYVRINKEDYWRVNMKRILMFFAPLLYMIGILMVLFFFESNLIDKIMEIFKLQDTSSINMFNRYFLYLLGLIMAIWTYRYSSDINVKINRIIVFVINLLGIVGLIVFVIQSQMIFWK